MPLRKFSLVIVCVVLLFSGAAHSTPKWWKVDSKLVFTEIEGLSAVDSLHVWAAACTTPQMTHSMDGGWNWTPQTLSNSPCYIDFVDTLRGWGLTAGIVRTMDGGQHWTVLNTPLGMRLFNLDFIDSLHGVVVGDSGFALFTSDGGFTWRKSRYPIAQSAMLAVEALDTSHIWVGGLSLFSDSAVVFFSPDWGQTWQPQLLPDSVRYPSTVVEAIDFPDTLNGFLLSVVGGGSASFLYRTSNGGATWNKIYEILNDDWDLNDMDAVDTLHLWMAGNLYQGGNYAAILSTTDGGNSWNTTKVLGDWFYKIEMASNHRGWASGSEGLLYTYAELVRGDLDLDGNFSAADIVLELNKVFLSQPYPALAPAGDVNCDMRFSASDVVLLIRRVFLEAQLPCTD